MKKEDLIGYRLKTEEELIDEFGSVEDAFEETASSPILKEKGCLGKPIDIDKVNAYIRIIDDEDYNILYTLSIYVDRLVNVIISPHLITKKEPNTGEQYNDLLI